MNFKTLCLFVGLLGAGVGALAQDQPTAATDQKKLPREVPSPEKNARRMTDEMKRELKLTDKQYEKLYDLHLKEEKERFSAMQGQQQTGQRPPREGGPGGGGRPPMGGGQPPMGGGGRPGGGGQPPAGGFGQGESPRAPKDAPTDEERQKAMAARDKKIKKILTPEQYEKWETIEKKRVPAAGSKPVERPATNP